MTQTPPPTAGSGIDTENLRSYEKLRRSTTDRKIAGVAGGLGRHLNIDPTLIRVLFVVLIFFGGAGLLLYAAAWLIVPEEGSDRSVVSTSPGTRNTLLIIAAVVAALLLVGDSWGGFGFPWPLAILALIVFLVLVNRDRGATPGEQYAAPAGPPAPPYTWETAGAPPPPPPAKADRGPKLFGIALALVAVALGSLGLAETAAGADVADAAYPALALAVIGAMLVVGAWFGRAGGLILLGIVATLALAIGAATDGGWTTERRISATPVRALAVADSYSLTAGTIDLDLTEVRDLEGLDGRTVDIDAEAGEIVVTVPDGLDVAVNGDIRWGGAIEIDGHSADGGSNVDLSHTIDGGADVPSLELDINLTLGHIVVTQEEAA